MARNRHVLMRAWLVASWLVALPVLAGAPPLPVDGTDKHLGNDTCGSAFCHSAEQPWKVSAVTQQEFHRWEANDPHAHAYEVLKGEKARQIARKLGIGAPEQSQQCLDCHADNVPAEKRGRHFSLDDGVGCEACHGGADRWLGLHVSGTAGHAENLAAGMYPTDQPVARAALCTSCHVGNADKFVDHRLLGSGHPRLAFELDTYTAAGANHFRVTDEYRKRKGIPNHARIWAVGQAQVVRSLMDGIADPARFNHGAYPELAYFDCYACHHSMASLQWTPMAALGNRTGMPHLNDAHLYILQLIAQQMAPAKSAAFQQARLALHAATLQGMDSTARAARTVAARAAELQTEFAQQPFRSEDTLAMARVLVRDAQQGVIRDYLVAEQATLSMSSLIAALHDGGAISAEQHQSLVKALDRVYATVATPEQFDAARFRTAMQALAPLLPTTVLPTAVIVR